MPAYCVTDLRLILVSEPVLKKKNYVVNLLFVTFMGFFKYFFVGEGRYLLLLLLCVCLFSDKHISALI